jgi:hypothetical protein
VSDAVAAHQGVEVSAPKRALVGSAETWLASEGIQVPAYVVEWVELSSLDERDVAYGATANRRETPARIYIRADLTDAKTFLTAVHELGHVADVHRHFGRYSAPELEARACALDARARATVVVPATCPLSTVVPELRRLHQEARVAYARANAARLGEADARASEFAQALIVLLGASPKEREAALLRLRAEGRRYLGLA